MNIDVGTVAAVLLADGWHDVWGKSFTISPRKFYEVQLVGPEPARETYEVGGDSGNFAVDWFAMKEPPDGLPMAGPLSAVLAVRLAP